MTSPIHRTDYRRYLGLPLSSGTGPLCAPSQPQTVLGQNIVACESQFIKVHQMAEIAFSLVIENVHLALRCLYAERIASDPSRLHVASQALSRARTALMDVVPAINQQLSAMTADEFKAFRSFLGKMSGADSLQFRTIEGFVGIKTKFRKSPSFPVMDHQPSLYDVLWSLLLRQKGSPKDQRLDGRTDTAETWLHVLKSNHQGLRNILLEILALEHGLLRYRQSHLDLVLKFIPNVPGTGGSAGAPYLRQALELSPQGKILQQAFEATVTSDLF